MKKDFDDYFQDALAIVYILLYVFVCLLGVLIFGDWGK
jgi:hypothetical protein